MLKPAQARMARAALSWSLLDAQNKTGINKNTIVRFEAGRGVLLSTAMKLQETFNQEGLAFTDESDEVGQGVVFSKALAKKLDAALARTMKPISGKRSQKAK